MTRPVDNEYLIRFSFMAFDHALTCLQEAGTLTPFIMGMKGEEKYATHYTGVTAVDGRRLAREALLNNSAHSMDWAALAYARAIEIAGEVCGGIVVEARDYRRPGIVRLAIRYARGADGELDFVDTLPALLGMIEPHALCAS